MVSTVWGLLVLGVTIINVNLSSAAGVTQLPKSQITEPPKDEGDIYFYVSEFAPRCFYEELPGETILKGDYIHVNAKTKPLRIVVINPSGEVLLTEEAEAKGRFAHHAFEAGMYKVCIEPIPESRWPTIEIQAKEAEVEGDIAKKQHLSALERELQEMEMKVRLLLQDLEYSATQEKHFREQSERINTRIIFWSILQVRV
jgi:hypothetical protein